MTEQGEAWMPIGQNDAITWPDLAGCFCRRDLPSVEAYLHTLATYGVTCLRLMLEYCQGEYRYFERPLGHFQPNMIKLWDDLFTLCENYGLRILLTPFDTFWMWRRWSHHPYNQARGGPCAQRSQVLLCPNTRAAIKRRLAFVTERWGGSGAFFAWDLYNEIHPAHAENSAEPLAEFIEDISNFLRTWEIRLHGRTHPQTVSIFGPQMGLDSRIVECAFRHPALDFANNHIYEWGTIDNPSNTVDAAISMGQLVREALAEIQGNRPFFDSEHGPIHSFIDRHKSLPESFDNEYFRHMQWAHFASGGAGGGMRWPYRHPHTLTQGMREAQRALADFLPLINWQCFQRKNWNQELKVSTWGLTGFACKDEQQAIVWLLRTDCIEPNGMLYRDQPAVLTDIQVPALKPGRYQVTAWDTVAAATTAEFELDNQAEVGLSLEMPPIITDLALAIRRVTN